MNKEKWDKNKKKKFLKEGILMSNSIETHTQKAKS